MNEKRDAEDQVRDLIRNRDKEYGSAWITSSRALDSIPSDLWFRFQVSCMELLYSWIIIHNKLFRILASPRNIDHWKDIAGYAQLVVDYLEEEDSRCGCLEGRE